MLRKAVGNAWDTNAGELAPNWEGPYRVTAIVGAVAYYLEGHGMFKIYEGSITNFRWELQVIYNCCVKSDAYPCNIQKLRYHSYLYYIYFL